MGRHAAKDDGITCAWLQGAASRHAGWTRPAGDARAAAVAELREIATQERPHRAPLLRTDLLGQVAGILRGTAPASYPDHHLIAAELLEEAGADPAEVERWTAIGRTRTGRITGSSADRGPEVDRPRWTSESEMRAARERGRHTW